nr:MAG TPA: hypothetical protein [Caudoviricetes sp.]
MPCSSLQIYRFYNRICSILNTNRTFHSIW